MKPYIVILIAVVIGLLAIVVRGNQQRIAALEKECFAVQPLYTVNLVPHSTAKFFVNGEEVDGTVELE